MDLDETVFLNNCTEIYTFAWKLEFDFEVFLVYVGEKLSKQQLQNSNIIKKLRSKEKENEGLIASQKSVHFIAEC